MVCVAGVFGLNGKNYIKTMIGVGKTHDSVRGVNDQISMSTYTRNLARPLVDIIETEKYGFYYLMNEGRNDTVPTGNCDLGTRGNSIY